MSRKFWADVNTSAIVYYRPLSKEDAIKLNESQSDEYFGHIEMEGIEKLDEYLMRPILRQISGDNFWSYQFGER